MTIDIDIAVSADGWDGAEHWALIADQLTAELCDFLRLLDLKSELSVLLTDDAGIQQINAQWRDQNKPTNVLSFPTVALNVGDRPGPILGDIIIAYETVCREAELENKSFDDHFKHLFIHGFLHLLGYDHENEDDAQQMEDTEIRILSALGVKNPYATEMMDS